MIVIILVLVLCETLNREDDDAHEDGTRNAMIHICFSTSSSTTKHQTAKTIRSQKRAVTRSIMNLSQVRTARCR
eukprot:2011802-Rhodomonas_salina.2